jgi:catechol 2,3-dioxygenase-like lactoylglutathione lyase family enzyme
MSLAHLTLATRDVERTARFFEKTLGYARTGVPENVPNEARWLDIGHGQQMHILYVENFEISPFEAEFGRHAAFFYPRERFATLKERLIDEGAVFIEPLRTTPFERFFFREPVNGYVLEVIETPLASHLDQ